MNSIWNKNYSAFKARFPQLAAMLPVKDIKDVDTSFWEITNAKNGLVTCSEKGIRLHSAYNPEREAFTGISKEEIENKSATVFYGFGLGYHVVQWAKKYISSDGNNKKLVIIEPDYEHFFGAMSLIDWTDVFKLKNIVLAIGCPAESVLSLIEDPSNINVGDSGVSDAYFFSIPAFMAHEKEYFDTVQEIIKRNKKKNDINAATLKKFGKLWCRNSMKNINEMKNLSPVTAFPFNSLATGSMPFLIIGAGPSLEKVLPYMGELKKRTVIICVETALKALLKAGVQPDFIIITDSQFWAYRHIAGLAAPESILIAEITGYPSVFRFPCKKVVLCGSQFPIGQYFQSELNINMGDLGTGGSVAASAWNLAHMWGAKEIFTAGLDFAFPENKTHIKGSDSEETLLTVSNKINTVDNASLKGLFSANVQEGKDFFGNKVLTDSRMSMFSWWFEARIANCPETTTYTLCPEGLYTPGIKVGKLEQLLKYPDISQQKKSIINKGEKSHSAVYGDKVQAFNSLLQDFPNKEFNKAFPFLKEYI